MLTFPSLTPFCRQPTWHCCRDLPHHPSSSNAHTYIHLSVSRASWLLVILYLNLLRLSPLFAPSTQAATDDRQSVRSRSAAALSRGALRQPLPQRRGYHCGTCLSSCPERPSVYTGFGMRCPLISPPRTAIGQAGQHGDCQPSPRCHTYVELYVPHSLAFTCGAVFGVGGHGHAIWRQPLDTVSRLPISKMRYLPSETDLRRCRRTPMALLPMK